MRFYGPMGFARTRVVCSARGLCARRIRLFAYIYVPRVCYIYTHGQMHTHIYEFIYTQKYAQAICVFVCHQWENEGMYIYVSARERALHRGKVPTDSLEESKRRPCPLQTSTSSSSPSPHAFLPAPPVYSFSSFLAFFRRSGPRLDSLTGAWRPGEGSSGGEGAWEDEVEKERREGQKGVKRRKKNGTSMVSTKSREVLPSEAPYETDNLERRKETAPS